MCYLHNTTAHLQREKAESLVVTVLTWRRSLVCDTSSVGQKLCRWSCRPPCRWRWWSADGYCSLPAAGGTWTSSPLALCGTLEDLEWWEAVWDKEVVVGRIERIGSRIVPNSGHKHYMWCIGRPNVFGCGARRFRMMSKLMGYCIYQLQKLPF